MAFGGFDIASLDQVVDLVGVWCFINDGDGPFVHIARHDLAAEADLDASVFELAAACSTGTPFGQSMPLPLQNVELRL